MPGSSNSWSSGAPSSEKTSERRTISLAPRLKRSKRVATTRATCLASTICMSRRYWGRAVVVPVNRSNRTSLRPSVPQSGHLLLKSQPSRLICGAESGITNNGDARRQGIHLHDSLAGVIMHLSPREQIQPLPVETLAPGDAVPTSNPMAYQLKEGWLSSADMAAELGVERNSLIKSKHFQEGVHYELQPANRAEAGPPLMEPRGHAAEGGRAERAHRGPGLMDILISLSEQQLESLNQPGDERPVLPR